MVHSTGANNPWLKRYVGPDDGLLGKNQYNNHWNQPMDREVCVHAFIGKLADGTIATYQTLPWDHRGWHCGSGSKGSGNNTHISFEICEDGLTDSAYFNKVYNEAVELCAYLCKQYGLTEEKYHLPQRGPCAGHCLQSRGCHALVPEAWEEHGHIPRSGEGQAGWFFFRQYRRFCRQRHPLPGEKVLERCFLPARGLCGFG